MARDEIAFMEPLANCDPPLRRAYVLVARLAGGVSRGAQMVSLTSSMRKLEIGCGHRPTPGYIHNDLNAFEGVDIVGNPWEIDLPDGSLSEVIALGLVEHLTYDQVDKTLKNVARMLVKGGVFLFDVPDIPVWCKYVVDHFSGKTTPFPIDHVFNTLYGWQRWPGDEHKSGWYKEKLDQVVVAAGYTNCDYGLDGYRSRGLERNRFLRPADAHLYCTAVK